MICFDVLIHQHNFDTYRAFVREIVNATREVAIINGYETTGPNGHVELICAFHEPLTHTLAEVGEGQVTVVGPFRTTQIVRIDKRSPAAA